MPADCITSSYKQLHIMVGILDGVPAVVARFLAGVGSCVQRRFIAELQDFERSTA